MVDYIVVRSELLETIDEAWAYYKAKFVGVHEIHVKGANLTIQFTADEIHLFTEKLKTGQMPAPDKLVPRPGSNEVRYFSKARARLLDRVVATLENPAGSVDARERGGVMVFGPVDRDGQRLAVVVYQRGERWVVRTAYPLTAKEFMAYKRSCRVSPWPP